MGPIPQLQTKMEKHFAEYSYYPVLILFSKIHDQTSNLINIENAVLYISTNVAVFAIIIFVCIYAVFSILVILFNLPTSSVFEQKLEEVMNFQRLSQSGNPGQDEDQIYQILLESSVSAVIANAAWLEINEYRSSGAKILYHKINDKRKNEIERSLDEDKDEKDLWHRSYQSIKKPAALRQSK